MPETNPKPVDSQRPSPQTLQSLVAEKQREEAELRRLKRK